MFKWIMQVWSFAVLPLSDLWQRYQTSGLSEGQVKVLGFIYRRREWVRRFGHARKWYGWRVIFWLVCLPVHWIDYRIDRRFRAFRSWTRGKLIFWHLRGGSKWCCRQFERLYIHPDSDLPF